MERIALTSHMIKAVGYDTETQILEVEFLDRIKKDKTVVPGAIWQYSDVPPEVYDKLIHAQSAGSFFGISIRACYEGKRVDAQAKE